jgi:hypothetical protein
VERNSGRRGARVVEEFGKKTIQPLGLFLEDGGHLIAEGGIGPITTEKFGGSLNGGEWGTDFVSQTS